MLSKVAIVLATILVVSIFGNYILYQNNQYLSNHISELNSQIEQFQKQGTDIQKEIESIKVERDNIAKLKSELSQKQVPNPVVTVGSKSITAVAVRPIMISDGFFQEVKYSGIVLSITVDIKDGSGLVLVNTAIPTGVDFQTSAKTAVKASQMYTGTDLSNKDVIFSISSKNENELQAVDGSSAGMAMTVLLVKEIQDKPISDKILLTGTIQEDGSIGPVGGIPEKAEAASKTGATTFIVPKGQAITYVQECEEKQQGIFLYRTCRSEVKDLSPIIEEKYGMKVVEAADLKSVLRYFD
ncbi:MAG: S16 family serine protease [Nitrosarchaeum sp.]